MGTKGKWSDLLVKTGGSHGLRKGDNDGRTMESFVGCCYQGCHRIWKKIP